MPTWTTDAELSAPPCPPPNCGIPGLRQWSDEGVSSQVIARLDTRYPGVLGVLLTLRWGPLWAYAGAQLCQVSSALLSLLCGELSVVPTHLLAPCPPAVIGGSQLSWKLWASALENRSYPGGNSEGANLY